MPIHRETKGPGWHCLQKLSSLPSFMPLDDKTQKDILLRGLLSTAGMRPLNPAFGFVGYEPSSSHIDNIDCHDRLENLGSASFATILPQIQDKYGFKDVCDKTVAQEFSITLVQDLIAPLLGQHINTHLKGAGLPSLQDLRNDGAAVVEFKDLVTDETFADQLDDRTSNDLALATLFTYEYLEHGPDFKLPKSFADCSSAQVLGSWADRLFQQALLLPTDQIAPKLRKHTITLARASSAVFNPQGRADTMMLSYARALHTSGLVFSDSLLGRLDAADRAALTSDGVDGLKGPLHDQSILDAYQALSKTLWDSWKTDVNNSVGGPWSAAVLKAENTEAPYRDTANGGDRRHVHRTRTWGEAVVDWVQLNFDKQYLIQSKTGDIKNTTHEFVTVKPQDNTTPAPQPSCFVPGTLIWTSSGQVPIESLQENMTILTRGAESAGSMQQWGTASDEVVQQKAPQTLYSFNGGAAFVTAGHVFFTTTGQRAISPALAKAENPWMDPGQLQIGHKLLHTEDGHTYQLISIDSIDAHDSNVEHVYGVHLRGGLRSYHANGFLVAMNYPEITIASVAKQLSLLPKHARLDLISKMQELKPILDRFGGQTTLKILKKESKSKSLVYGGPGNHDRFHLKHVSFPYRMDLPQGNRGPAVDLHLGVLHVDKRYCERATIDKDSITWVRPLPSGDWEYASCRFSNNGNSAQGFRHIGQHPDRVVDADVEDLVARSPIEPFSLVLTSENHPAMHNMAAAGPGQLTWDIAYDPKPNEGLNDPDADVETLCSVDLGKVVKKEEGGGLINYPIKDLQIYDDLLEKIVAKAKESVKDDKSLGSITDLTSLYKRRVWFDPVNQVQTYEWVLAAPEAVIHNSDNYAQHMVDLEAHDKDQSLPVPDLPTTNLTFTKIGCKPETTIPMLINTITTVWDTSGREFDGTLRRFDPKADGCNGDTHLLAGSRAIQPPMFLAAVAAASIPSPIVPIHQPHADTTIINMLLIHRTNKVESAKVEHLGKLGYNQKGINDQSQAMIKKVMLYHMDDSERTMFFQVAKPMDLQQDHPEFGDALDTTCGPGTRDWFKTTYSRAYICQILTEHSIKLDGSKSFTDGEKRSIRYFWNGHGEGCLSREDRYKVLEKKISRKLILSLATNGTASIYDDYIKDPAQGGAGGDYWSEAVLKHYNDIGTLEEMLNPSTANGSNMLTKLGAFMDALDQGKERPQDTSTHQIQATNSNILCYASNKVNMGATWTAQFTALYTNDKKAAMEQLEADWYQETMTQIIQELLSGSELVSGDLAKGISQDAQKLVGEMNEAAGKNKRDQAILVAKMFATSAKNMIKLLAATRRKLLSGFWSAATYLRGTPIIGRGIEWMFKKKYQMDNSTKVLFTPEKERLFKGVMFLGSMAFMGWSLFSAFAPDKSSGTSAWNAMGTVERAQTIVNTFGVIKQIGDCGTDFVEICVRIKNPGTYSVSAEAAVDAAVNNMMQKKLLATDWVYFEKTADGAVTTKTETFLDTTATAEEIAEADSAIGAEVGVEVGEDMIKACSKLKRAFNIARTVLKCVGYVLAIAVAVFMTWKLIQDWPGMNVWHKVLETIQVACAIMEAIGSAVMLGATIVAEILAAAGAAAAEGAAAFVLAASTIFTAFTLVLLAIVILAIIILAIWEALQPPPESEISKWIGNVGKHIETWAPKLKAPATPLTVVASPADGRLLNSDTPQMVEITFSNASTNTAKLDALEVTFEVASEKSALFTTASKFEKKPDDEIELKANHFRVGVVSLTSEIDVRDPMNVPKTWAISAKDKADAYTVTITITGKPPAPTANQPDQHDTLDHYPFTLGAMGSVTISLMGVSNFAVGQKEETGVTWRQFWNQETFDQDEERCWLWRDK